MESRYNHADHEAKIYQKWLEQDLFNPDTTTLMVQKNQLDKHQIFKQTNKQEAQKSKPFTIIMPPPNANDPLHVGHAMFVALEDAMIRYHRMKGDDTLWLPGVDHAGIETQFVFEKKLAKKGQSRFNFNRQNLYQQIWDYVQENADVAKNQLQKIGASADWDRFKFTLDENIVKTVLKTFQLLYEKGLIYRDEKLVNYCPKCGTAFSELEINHLEQKSPLYYLKYGPLVVATTRPETTFGDVAVAVHPDDKRFKQYIGKNIEVKGVIGSMKLKVVADEYVDPEFGTGVVKITPAHDHNDYEIWQRHLDEIGEDGLKQVIGFDGRLNELTGKFAGMKVGPAREAVIEEMQKLDLIEAIDENYVNITNRCYRCNSLIEPLPLAQIFIKVKPLVESVKNKIKRGELEVLGAGHDKILMNWLNGLRDWNISRQIVWGIRQPVWYRASENPEIVVTYLNANQEQKTGKLGELLTAGESLTVIKRGLQMLMADSKAKFIISLEEPDGDYLQETDTFDTWFSSSQWPFATLKNTQDGDFERFYPTSVLETGYDILPFWVMRMLMMGEFATGKLPFKTVYLHGLIRDSKGQKMSKSKGNVINPNEMVDKYGADALRLALVIRSSAGLDKSVGEGDFKAARNLTNKIWNAGRFLLMQSEEKNNNTNLPQTREADKTVREKMKKIIAEITQNMDKYQLGLAADSLYNYFWHYYCDELIGEQKNDKISLVVLKETFLTFLKLWQPLTPFVVQAVWEEIRPIYQDKNETEQLIVANWPKN